jgi:hypothetical protein
VEIKEISFRRKFNLGNYETVDIELVATIGPGQDALEVLKALDAKTIEYRKSRT